MAITHRKGDYNDYDPSRMRPAEFGITLMNDPKAVDGRAVHIAFAAGEDKTLMTFEDAEGMIEDAAEEATAAATSQAQQYATNSQNSATESRSYAKGGTSSRSGEDTDNAMYYKNQAANSATAASNSAAAASGSASTASTKASEAATSATNASGSATAAATSAGQAASSATAASGSATAAADSAEDAQEMSYTAEAWAVGTKNGIDVGSSDPQYHNNAKYYQEQAEAVVESIPEDYSELSDDVDQLKNALPSKAEQDGAYPDFTAGQMLSKNEASDSVPYNFRAVEQEATLEYTDAIVGGSVVKNQFCNDPTFTDESKWDPSSTMTVTISNNVAECVASAVNATLKNNGIRSAGTLNGHVVGVLCDLKADEAYNVNIAFGDNYLFTDLQTKAINTSWATYGMLAKHAEVRMESVYAGIRDSHNSGWKKIYVKNYRVFDLTKALGKTIADYVYTLETATAGAGIAWLRQHFPKLFTYQSYNVGEIVSVQGLSQHVTVGFNQFDKTTVKRGMYVDNDGSEKSYGILSHTDYIQAFPNTIYYVSDTQASSNVKLCACFDSRKNFIEFAPAVGNDGRYRQTLPNTAYIMVNMMTSVIDDICINISNSAKNGTYEPYQKHIYPLDDSLILRGILKLDASNNLYADGDRYLPDGTVQRRYAVVDMGTLNWEYNASTFGGSFYTSITNSGYATTGNAMCTKYPTVYTGASVTNGDKVLYAKNNGLAVYTKDTTYTDAATFKAAMSGVYLVYELAEPTTEEADPYTVPQIIDPNGTEEYVSTSIVPVGHESRYPLDIAGRLDKILTMPTANGTYTLRATVNNGAVTYAWVST